MSTFAIIVLVLAALVVLLAVGGAVANSRRRRRGEARFRRRLEHADRELAEAYAADKGWEREGLEGAARRAWRAERPGDDAADFVLVEVVDRPGIEEDLAVFQVTSGGRSGRVTLARGSGEWRAERVE